MKIIFLDIDGVLNTACTQGVFELSCFEAFKYLIDNTEAKIVLSSTWRYNKSSMDTLALKFIETNIFKDKSKVYLSHTPNFSKIDGEPALSFIKNRNSHLTRTDEILLWLKFNTIPRGYTLESCELDEKEYFPLIPKLNKDYIESNNELWSNVGSWILDFPIELDQFIILDDMNLSLHSCYCNSIVDHFIRTPLQSGLTISLAEKAVNILNSTPFNYKHWRKNTFKKCNNPNCEVNNCLNENENENTRKYELKDNSKKNQSSKILLPFKRFFN